MKAIKFCEYGPPDVLKLEEVEKPVPKDNELLVRVRAASLNFIDAGLVRGPSVLRFMSGLRKPKFTGFGRDFAGVVEATGKDVTEFKPGDEVFGVRWGALAEYVCVRKDRVALKPANITFEQAGAVGLAGLTALQGLQKGKIHAGQKVLINGASGGVGTFAVEIAKAFDTEVTAVLAHATWRWRGRSALITSSITPKKISPSARSATTCSSITSTITPFPNGAAS